MREGYDSDDYSGDASVVLPQSKLLSKMTGDQASGLKGLERIYEEVLDENCRVFVKYFEEVLESKDDSRSITPPLVVLREVDTSERNHNDTIKVQDELGWTNGRYNVMLQSLIFSPILN